MSDHSELTKGFDLACNYIGYRARTEKEINDYLERKGFAPDAAGQIVAKLKTYNYINDEEYVRNAVRGNVSGERYGKKRLIEKLRQKGIPEKYLEWTDRAYPEKAEKCCTEYHFYKAAEKYRRETPVKQRNKISAYMARRGFAYGSFEGMFNQLRAVEDDAPASAGREELEKYYRKYYNMQSRKGYTGRELEQRVIRNLMSRGFRYDEIKEVLQSEELRCAACGDK